MVKYTKYTGGHNAGIIEMHELPVAQNILNIALRHAGDARRVAQINLVIGDLSSIVGESVKFYWDLISKDTIAEGSKINIERIKTLFHCNNCGKEFEPTNRKFDCIHCDSDQVELVTGREFRLESIEVE